VVSFSLSFVAAGHRATVIMEDHRGLPAQPGCG
jgi:hypothetical protein